MTPRPQRMSEAIPRRGRSERTQKLSVRAVRQRAEHSHTSPARLTEAARRDACLSLKNVKHDARRASPIALCGLTCFSEHPLTRAWPPLRFVRAPPRTAAPCSSPCRRGAPPPARARHGLRPPARARASRHRRQGPLCATAATPPGALASVLDNAPPSPGALPRSRPGRSRHVHGIHPHAPLQGAGGLQGGPQAKGEHHACRGAPPAPPLCDAWARGRGPSAPHPGRFGTHHANHPRYLHPSHGPRQRPGTACPHGAHERSLRGSRGLSWSSGLPASGAMDPPSAPVSATVGPHATREPCRIGHHAVPRRVAVMAPRAQLARHARTALLPARLGPVPRANTTRPPGGSTRHGRCACPCPLCSSPFPCLRPCGLEPVRPSSGWTPGSCRPLRRPGRHAPWTPHPLAARAVWGASSTPGPARGPPSRLSRPASLRGHCRPTARRGSPLALRRGVVRCARCRTSSGARARRRSPTPTCSITPPPPSGHRPGEPMGTQAAPAQRSSPPSPPPSDA
jgi:hypothetical protein